MTHQLLKISALTLALIFSTFANAEGEEATADKSNGSEFMYQSEAGKFDITPHLLVGSTATKYDTNGQKRIEGYAPAGVTAEYGLNKMFAIGIDLNFMGTKSTYTCDLKPCPRDTTKKGFADPVLEFKGRSAVGPGTLRYGADLALGLMKSKIDSSGDSTAATGGTTLTPFVGYEMLLGPGFLGARFSYDIYKTDRKVTDESGTTSAEIKEKDGNDTTLSVFYEAPIHKVTYGASINYTNHSEARTSTNGAATVPSHDGFNQLAIKVYVPVQLTENIALLPSASYGTQKYGARSTIDGAVFYNVGVAGRFTF